jgi:hypothetical protein
VSSICHKRLDESFDPVLGGWQAGCEQLQAIHRKAFTGSQKFPEAAAFEDVDENNSHVLALSEKRDAVGLGKLMRPVRLRESRWLRNTVIERNTLIKDLWKPACRMCLQAWIYKTGTHGTNSGKRSAVGDFKQR